MARILSLNSNGVGVVTVPPGQPVIVKLDFAGGPGTNGANNGDKYLLICTDPAVVFDRTEYTVVNDTDQSCEFRAPAGIGQIDIVVALEGTPATGNTPIGSFTVMRQGTPAVPPAPPAAPPTPGVTVAANGWMTVGVLALLVSLGLAFIIGFPVVIGSVLGYIGMTSEEPTSLSDIVVGEDAVSVKGLDMSFELKADELSRSDGVDQTAMAEELRKIWVDAVALKCADASTPNPTSGLCTDGSKPTR
jgi:hypothetical protein